MINFQDKYVVDDTYLGMFSIFFYATSIFFFITLFFDIVTAARVALYCYSFAAIPFVCCLLLLRKVKK